MDKLDKNKIDELLPRYCEGQVTEEERLLVETWMNESEENRRVVKQIHSLYLATDTIHVMKKVDTEKALSRVKGRITGRKKTMWWHNVRPQFCSFHFSLFSWCTIGEETNRNWHKCWK